MWAAVSGTLGFQQRCCVEAPDHGATLDYSTGGWGAPAAPTLRRSRPVARLEIPPKSPTAPLFISSMTTSEKLTLQNQVPQQQPKLFLQRTSDLVLSLPTSSLTSLSTLH